MNQDFIDKLEKSVTNLKEKKNRIYFLVQDTKGNAKASVRYIYEMAYHLFKNEFNVKIIHEQNDYKGVGTWLSTKYDEMPHQSIESQNLEISPEDFIVIPELYGHVMEQISKLPCGKIVLTQSYDYVLETLPPGATWSQYGFTKCITTSQEQKEAEYQIAYKAWQTELAGWAVANFSKAENIRTNYRAWSNNLNVDFDITTKESAFPAEPIKDFDTIHQHTYNEQKEEISNAIRILKMTDEEVVNTSTYNAVARYL